MDLYFLRHAIAEKRDSGIYPDDSLRPLTPLGQKKMRLAALGMHSLGLKFDSILSSPWLRAYQTALIVAETYQIPKAAIHVTDHLLDPVPLKALLDEIQISFPKSKKILCVGHEPHLSALVAALFKSANGLDINFKKGGLCSLSVAASSSKTNAILNWLVTPTQLGMMAKPVVSKS